jgi:ribosomal protein S27AE
MKRYLNIENLAVIRDRYRLCPQCGDFGHFELRQKFCTLCGTRMLEECPNCHEPIIYPTARNCPACGEELVKAGDGRISK